MGVARRDRRPAYQRIADDLHDQITRGRYRPGDMLPSILQLCAMYQVCKTTASSALAVLDQRGVIAVRHGLRALVLAPHADHKDLTTVYQQVNTITDRQKQILAQVDSLGYTVRHVRQRVHELAQLVHQLDS
ncbi:MAG: winged helix-turn-helix domain-containing protein [Pyrinomonadaceae bacterium]